MLRTLLPLLTSPRARAFYVPIIEIVGSVCIVVAAFMFSAIAGFAVLGFVLLLAAIPVELWAKRPR